MPRYDAKRLEPKWQAFWDEHQTFTTGPFDPNKPKMYVLDMFPYPSGAGLHVGHPEGYTATDIVCRYSRMKGKQVLHPMGWDAFGLPAEEYAIRTGTHPAVTTAKNIETFKRQLKMLGFSYDWSRELATTDPDYYRWTQWIFLQLFDTWYDPEFAWTGPDGVARVGKGRPISELPIPAEIAAQGEAAVRRYQDKQRLAYQHEAPVNWCPALGTVLANEEVIDGKSERGGHPVERLPLRQWLLRITAYGDRLANELENLHWPESIKQMQRNWIGRSEGAEVDFWIGSGEGSQFGKTYADLKNELLKMVKKRFPKSQKQSVSLSHDTSHVYVFVDDEGIPESDGLAMLNDTSLTQLRETASAAFCECQAGFQSWTASCVSRGWRHEEGHDALRVYTTRPDTLFGVTYMVLAPEHPAVDRLTTPEQREAVDEYRQLASFKSDLDRTELSKTKSGVFTGGYAINPVNQELIPVWVADYVLISYGTGAIMAVPAHDERDWEFAKKFDLQIIPVVEAPRQWILDNAPPEVRSDILATEIDEQHFDNETIRWHRNLKHRTRARDFANAFTDTGTAINSDSYDRLPTLEFKSKITADLAAKGLGRKAINYRLRDWLFSRQRYWGEPFPIWHELDANGEPTGLMRVDADSELPVTLPEMATFKPTGTPEPMLSKAPESWLFKTASDGTKLKRETNTMPQWAGSCWYYLRFVDNKNSTAFMDPELEKQWLPIDLYVGGAEHAVLHLLYSRFWHKVLFDRGHVHTPEPFQRLVNQGMILGEVEFTGYRRLGLRPDPNGSESVAEDKAAVGTESQPTGEWVSSSEVSEDTEGNAILKTTGEKLATVKVSPDAVKKSGDSFVLTDRPDIRIESRAHKMSKARGNVVNPDIVVEEYGADALRLYEMFMGPLEQVKPWSMQGVEGVYRFLSRVWRTLTDDRAEDVRINPAVQDSAPSEPQIRLLHKTIKAVTHDLESLGFNTAISRLMEFMNEVTNWSVRPVSSMKPFVLLLSPLAPHIAEELWQLLGGTTTLAYEPWPTFDPKYVEDAVIDVPVQINGKLRAKITVDAKADQTTIETTAKADPNVASHLEGKTIAKVVYVPGRMINFVVK